MRTGPDAGETHFNSIEPEDGLGTAGRKAGVATVTSGTSEDWHGFGAQVVLHPWNDPPFCWQYSGGQS